jgi:hypothetical protein
MRKLASLLLAAAAWPETNDEFFEKSIRPVLAERCYQCHSSKLKTPMGGLRLDTAEGLAKGGDTGAAVVAGQPDKSLLIKAVGYKSLELRMPPTGKLPDDQIAALRRWIEMGAADPRKGPGGEAAAKPMGIDLAEGRKFWSLQPVRAVPPPPTDSPWAAAPVDRFLLAKMRGQGLSPAAPADKRSWLRRVTFDLVGLPPTPAEIDAFLADASSDARKTVVERLLASPHYGERWARHWLDLVRYAETNGHEFDNNKLDAWRYRDYVIRAFNQDVPYDQFVREHIAGDLMENPRATSDGAFLESPLGTGALWFGEVLNSATDSVKSRADTVDNQIDVLGKTFLGLTVACARCHDHKFDPIPTSDYYSLAGVLHSTGVREAIIDTPARQAAIRAGVAPKLREGDELFSGPWTPAGAAFDSPTPDARLVGSLTSAKFRMPKLWIHVRMSGTAQKPEREDSALRFTLVADDHKSLHLFPSGKPGYEWKTLRATKEIGRECYFEIVDRSRTGHIAVDKVVISDHAKPPEDRELPESAFAMVARDENVGDVRIHIRGSHTNLGQLVPRRFLRVIAGDDQSPPRGSGRLELAEWMASRRNPLTARVMVNRVWKHHFGQGLVRSADNFGRMGDRPSHPELLDWLAQRFMDGGWSVKDLHRTMALSNAYAMSSVESADAARLDPGNALLSHMPVRRLEAEAIRDSILAVTGKLDPKLYGPSVMPHISKYQDGRGKPESGPADGAGRRSIYVQVRRNFLTPMFLAFDYPLPISTIGVRGSSTVPSQALLMMNNEFVARSAKAWADGTASETDSAKRIERMYVAAFGRLPEDWERREVSAFAARGSWADVCHVLLNSAEFLYVR